MGFVIYAAVSFVVGLIGWVLILNGYARINNMTMMRAIAEDGEITDGEDLTYATFGLLLAIALALLLGPLVFLFGVVYASGAWAIKRQHKK